MITVYVRLYEELNRVLPETEHKKTITRTLAHGSTLNELLELLGLKQGDIDLALVNSRAVNFGYLLQGKDLVSLYPEFESLDIKEAQVLRESPLRNPRFLVEGALRELAGLLQARGYDCLWAPKYSVYELVRLSKTEKRILLSLEDVLAKNPELERGICLKTRHPEHQLQEVLHRFQLD